jgi:hypothetical protein
MRNEMRKKVRSVKIPSVKFDRRTKTRNTIVTRKAARYAIDQKLCVALAISKFLNSSLVGGISSFNGFWRKT